MAEKEVRLIDANALTEDVLNSFAKSDRARDVLIKHIQFAPTIDSESLRPHGKWIDQIALKKCSHCRVHQIDITPYCPNCGAKMDKE